ncbi:MAG TPA: hypothetical protein VNQ90_02025 [Chthoniobacteraceae bacterium]|nr:hypothetical protein [Chthoniobacteraceae bacterium]
MNLPSNLRSTRSALASLLLALTLGSAQAAIVIDYGGNYTTSNQSFSLPTPVDTGAVTRTWKYSDTVSISPADSASYSGPAVYGALQITSAGSTQENYHSYTGLQKRYPDNAGTNLIFMGQVGFTITGMFFFQPTVDPGSRLVFDETSSITRTSQGTGTTQVWRYVVQSDGLWYISSINAQLNELTPGTLPSSTWALFDPVNVAPLPAIPETGYTVTGSEFTDIQAVGIYFDIMRATNQPYLSIAGFTVNAQAIPEPATATLLVLSAGGCLWLGRRRR